MPRLPARLALLLAALSSGACAAGGDHRPPRGWPQVYTQDFREPAALHGLWFSDPRAWRWCGDGPSPCLELFAESAYEPPQRSPRAVALVGDLELSDFDLEVDAQQTGAEYGHRDLCLFFGWESPLRFYYAHLASQPDGRAHNVFLVDRADRRPLAPIPARGVEWGTGEWHRLRLERRLADGSIRVYFDGELALEAVDRTLGAGRVGVGSFDDAGRFTALRVWAPGGNAGSGR